MGNKDHEDGVRIVHAALDAGINFVDTADVYSHGESEEIVEGPSRAVVTRSFSATKVHANMGTGENTSGNSRRWIRYEVEQSLRRLGTDWIRPLQIHRPDPRTDIEETLSVLTDLIREGKVRAIGCSTFPAELIVEAHWAAERRGLERFRCEQPRTRCSPAGSRRECSRLRALRNGGHRLEPAFGGWLTGKYRHGKEIDMASGRASRIPQRFDPACRRTSTSSTWSTNSKPWPPTPGYRSRTSPLAFVVSHPAVTAAIIGPRTMDQLQDLIAGCEVTLDDATLDRLDEIVPPGTTLNQADAGWQIEALTQACASPACDSRAAG